MTHDEILQLLYEETLVGNAPAVKHGVERQVLAHLVLVDAVLLHRLPRVVVVRVPRLHVIRGSGVADDVVAEGHVLDRAPRRFSSLISYS